MKLVSDFSFGTRRLQGRVHQAPVVLHRGYNYISAFQIAGDEPTQPFSDAFGEEDDQSNTSKIAAMANKFLHNRQTSIKKTEPREPSFKPIEDEPSRTFVDKFDTLPSSLAISKSGLKSKFSLNSFSKFKADSDDHNSDADEKAVLRTGSDADNEPRTMFEEIEEYKVTNFNGRAESERDGDEICQKVDSDDSNVAANKDTSFSNTGHIQRANRRGRGRGRGGNISGKYTLYSCYTKPVLNFTSVQHHHMLR